MNRHQLEQLARHRVDQQVRRAERHGIRRSARLMAREIRASRRHVQG